MKRKIWRTCVLLFLLAMVSIAALLCFGFYENTRIRKRSLLHPEYFRSMERGDVRNAIRCAELLSRWSPKERMYKEELSDAYEAAGEYERALILRETYLLNHDPLIQARLEYKNEDFEKSFIHYCQFVHMRLSSADIRYKDPQLRPSTDSFKGPVDYAKTIIRRDITLEKCKQYYQARLSPFIYYSEFVTFMNDEFKKLNEPVEYLDEMTIVRDIESDEDVIRRFKDTESRQYIRELRLLERERSSGDILVDLEGLDKSTFKDNSL